MLFKAYQTKNGTYEEKMATGHKATWYVYQFIVFTRPLFMQNPISNTSKTLLWAKAIFLSLLLYVLLLFGTTLCMLAFRRIFKIQTFSNEKEYQDYVKKFNDDFNCVSAEKNLKLKIKS